MIPIPVNPDSIGDPNQTPVVYIGAEAGKALGIRDSSPPSPAQHPGQVDLDEVRRRYARYKATWTDRMVDHAMAAACAADAADDVPALLADLDAAREALRQAQIDQAVFDNVVELGRKDHRRVQELEAVLAETSAERDQLRYERRLLGMARRVLDLAAEGGHHGYDEDYIRNQARDIAQRIVDEIGHPATDEPALGPSFREQLAAADAERDRMRPVVEAARALREQQRRDVLEYGATLADRTEAFRLVREAFAAAVDSYETQEGTE